MVYKDNRAALRMYAKLEFAKVTVPGLEKMLEDEEATSGRRRIVLRREF